MSSEIFNEEPHLQCPICKRVGKNDLDEENWIVCKCGHDIKERDEPTLGEAINYLNKKGGHFVGKGNGSVCWEED